MNPVSLAQTAIDVLPVITPYLGVFAVALGVSLLVTPLMRWLAMRNGVVDHPDLGRKNHAKPIAYLGGAAVFLAWLAGMAACYFIEPHDPKRSGVSL